MLPEFLLRRTDDISGAVEDDGARTGRALVEREYERHESTPCESEFAE